jgi:hypothetical protein
MWVKRGFIVIIFPADFTYYIFSAKDGMFITRAKNIDATLFLQGKLNYFMVEYDRFKYAIFDKNGKQTSDWYDYVYQKGLLEGKSNYYVAQKDNKQAIFYKDGKQVTDWFDYIYREGLLEDKSDYYIARKDGKEAIFHKSGKQISDWFYWIKREGLVKRKSNYYIVRKDEKYAIFDKDGRQISDWYGNIYPDGLISGKSDYYIAMRNETIYLGKLGSSKVLGPFKAIKIFGFINSPSKDTIKLKMIEGRHKPRYKTFTKQEVDDFFEGKEMEDERTR